MPYVRNPSLANLCDILAQTVTRDPARPLVARRDGTSWVDVPAAGFAAEVDGVAKGLVAAGIAPGDRVALFAKTRYEWTLCDFAIWAAGAVTVPVYETSSAEQVAWIVEDSGARACFAEGRSHVGTVRSVAPGVQVWSWDAVDGVPALAELVDAGTQVPDAELHARRAALGRDSLATVIYTSGTTGRPKGCELTHGNFLAECESAVETLPELFEREDASSLLFLPLAHVFGRMIQVACVLAGVRIGHSDLARVTKDLATFRPSFVLAVPRVFEKVYETAARKAANEGKSRIFALAAQTAVAASRACDDPRPRPLLALRRAVFDRLVYSKLRAAFGGRVEWAVSGGAPLGERLAHFFRGAGITVLEGYGLTETTAATSVNTRAASRIGTVGRPFAAFDVRIAADGELQIRGGHVFPRYWHNEAATAEAFTDDGWFRTGDLGSIDADGFVRVTGRSKEIIVTSGGKNVSPAPLEDIIRSSPVVSQCMLVGDGHPYVAALVTLDPEADTTDAEAVRAQVQKAVDAANATVSQAESIHRFVILPGDFTEQGGQLTPTLKLKRSLILRENAAEVEQLYAGRSAGG